MPSEDMVQVSLRKSTVEMIRGYDPAAPTLDDAVEEMLINNPPPGLLRELDRREQEPTISREEARRKHGF